MEVHDTLAVASHYFNRLSGGTKCDTHKEIAGTRTHGTVSQFPQRKTGGMCCTNRIPTIKGTVRFFTLICIITLFSCKRKVENIDL